MKYLYSIFRLFFCPHKYELVKEVKFYDDPNQLPTRSVRIKSCVKCGKEKSFKP